MRAQRGRMADGRGLTDVDAAQEVRLDVEGVTLAGDLARPPRAAGLILFAHGSGSSRHLPEKFGFSWLTSLIMRAVYQPPA